MNRGILGTRSRVYLTSRIANKPVREEIHPTPKGTGFLARLSVINCLIILNNSRSL